jgi:DNA transformation protein
LRAEDDDAAKNFFLQARQALTDVHWNDLPAERKEALNRQLDAISTRQKN